MRRKTVLGILKKHEQELRAFKVKALFLFGSVARDEASKGSDIDLLVEFDSADVDFFEFMRLKFFLEKILKAEVDLVTRDALKAWMIGFVEKESIRAA